MACDPDDLKIRTHKYWNDLASAQDPESRDAIIETDYLNALLRDEIACAQERAQKQDGVWPQKQAEVLVLLVGHSIEPLLQTVCAYRPREIILVLSPKYDKLNGQRFADERVVPWLNELKELSPPLIKRQFEVRAPVWPKPPQGSQPGDIFRLLLHALRKDVTSGKNIVIDITGGKKSMVAGAYFFAAYTNAKISYVDFEDYHEAKRRPYGFMCQIGLLPNPYELFGLRDWEQVKNLYRRFFFDEAIHKLQSIVDDMKNRSAEYFVAKQVQAVALLIEMMQFYHAWSIGDYALAKSLSDRICKQSKDFKPLASVEALHPIWPQNIEDDQKLRVNDWDFYANSELILQYALDESAKVDRLVKLKEDYRSGLLRAAGLNEVLLKARLASLWINDMLTLYKKSQPLSDSDTKDTIADGMKVKAWLAEKILQMRTQTESSFGKNSAMTAKKSADALPYMSNNAGLLKKLKDIRERRNKVIHFVIPISKQTALEAVDMMHKNVQDFEQVWVKSVSPEQTISTDELPSWRKLCEWCKIDFLPNQREEKPV